MRSRCECRQAVERAETPPYASQKSVLETSHDASMQDRAEHFHRVASGVSIAVEVRMKKIFNALAISALVVGFASAAHAQVSVGVRIGPPPAPRAYRVPPRAAPDREWVEGHWTRQGSHYRWHDGTWARPRVMARIGSSHTMRMGVTTRDVGKAVTVAVGKQR